MKNKSCPEVLAPAGSEQALLAALRCGADAVYLGGSTLNARRNAANFDDAALRQAVFDCHARGVKVYLTLNTLLRDTEQSDAIRMLETACALAMDAVIVQDLGLARLARRCAPTLPLHASTQMSVQTRAGLGQLAELGFRRAVLPRELSRGELEKLAKDAPLELEVFVHGALCVGVSGQCLMSAVLGGRSGNRGLCAQPCRLPFTLGNFPNALSLKDLFLLDNLPDLVAMGIRSFKIEGRMKRPEYVAAAVTACKKVLAGQDALEERRQLQEVFSRSGFTQGYYQGERGAKLFGTRQKEDVLAARDALPALARLYQSERPRIPLYLSLRMKPDVPVCLAASAAGVQVEAEGEIPQRAQIREHTREELLARLEKCGGTPFYTEQIEIDLAPGLFLPVSSINSLRRQALTQLENRLARREALPFIPMQAEQSIRPPQKEETVWHARCSHWRQLPPLADFLLPLRRVILPLDTPAQVFARLQTAKIEAAVEIPRGIFGAEKAILRGLKQAKENGATQAVAGTLDGVALARRANLPVNAGFGMNIMNAQSLHALADLGAADALLSCEMNRAQIRDLGGALPRGVFVYGKLPLMLLRNCPRRSCTNCPARLTDRKGASFPLQCKNGVRELLNDRPVYLADRLQELRNTAFHLLYFTDETPTQCAKILEAYRVGAPPSDVFTRGLFERGVL